MLGKKDKKISAFPLTNPEHTPEIEHEKIRIYNNRGETRSCPLDKKVRIYVRARMYPGLSISRSLGDILAHHIGVTSEPNVDVHHLNSSDKFVAIGSDGIWDYLGYDEVVEIINDYGIRDPGTSTEFICSKARDVCYSNSSVLDDMSIIVSFLHDS